jgi:hypothetical protein
MQIVKEYPIQIEHWVHLPIEKFMGLISDNGYNYILGITPEDPNEPECCYFNVWVEKKMTNETTKTIVFYAKTFSCFKVKNEYQKPTVQFYYSLIDKATYEFALLFHQKTQKTNLSHHKIQKPPFQQFQDEIEKTIEIWDRTARNRIFLTPPNWQTTFWNLPEIPEHKKWVKGSYTTIEQDISFKLLHKKPITPEEEKIFTGLTSFYEELDKELKLLDYGSFTSTDFENFKNYIFYAFNYMPLITNDLTVFSTYRLVVNEFVTKKNESITNIEFLKYPTLEKVKEINKYNRANTPDTNVFYSAGSIDTALKEIRPPLNKLVTVGIWKPKNVDKKLISYPISHSQDAIEINKSVQDATRAFEDTGKHTSPLFMKYMRQYCQVLGHEFSKKVDYSKPNYHYEYLISALFSERIFSEHQEMNDEKNFKFNCIIYPSVGNDYLTENVAILPTTLDNDFYLAEVQEFEVDESYYDAKNYNSDPEIITLAKIKNFRKSKTISQNGQIKW